MKTYFQLIEAIKPKPSKPLTFRLLPAKPWTICDVLASPTPKGLITICKEGAEVFYDSDLKMFDVNKLLTNYPAWVRQLEKYGWAMGNFFDLQGSQKMSYVSKILEMAACKNRAEWTYWTGGKVYRGLGKTPADLKNYSYTGEHLKAVGEDWLIGSTTYKSKYDIQSWTPNIKVAARFAISAEDNIGLNHKQSMAAMIELDIDGSDTFLSPQIIRKLSEYPGEDEVLRVKNNAVPVVLYIRLKDILFHLQTKTPKNIQGNEDTHLPYMIKLFEGLMGSANAKKLLANPTVFAKIKKLVKFDVKD
jgi:hypothetical protein